MKQLKYALSLGTMLSLPIMASAVEITTTGAATPIQQQDAYNLAHQYSPTQAQRFTNQTGFGTLVLALPKIITNPILVSMLRSNEMIKKIMRRDTSTSRT